jgi:hypothetical protein
MWIKFHKNYWDTFWAICHKKHLVTLFLLICVTGSCVFFSGDKESRSTRENKSPPFTKPSLVKMPERFRSKGFNNNTCRPQACRHVGSFYHPNIKHKQRKKVWSPYLLPWRDSNLLLFPRRTYIMPFSYAAMAHCETWCSFCIFFLSFFCGSATPCAFPPPRPSIFSDYSFRSTALLTGMTGISLHMQWPLTFQSHGSVSQREQLVFHYGSNSNSFCILKMEIHLCQS